MALNSEIKALTINGTKIPVVDGTWTWTFGGFNKTPLKGSGQVLGDVSEVMEATCGFDVAFVAGSDLTAYEISGGQIAITWDGGDKYLMTGATLSAPLDGAAASGTLTLAFYGNKWRST